MLTPLLGTAAEAFIKENQKGTSFSHSWAQKTHLTQPKEDFYFFPFVKRQAGRFTNSPDKLPAFQDHEVEEGEKDGSDDVDDNKIV